MSWFSAIKKFNATKGSKYDEKKIAQEIEREFQKIMETALKEKSENTSYTTIPRFYTPKLGIRSLCKVNEQNKSDEITAEDIDAIWDVLQLHNTEMRDTLSYDEYLQVFSDLKKRGLEKKTSFFFSSKMFLLFPKDKEGKISIDLIHELITKKVTRDKLKSDLESFDSNKDGRLTEQELTKYILSIVASLPRINQIDSSMRLFYSQHSSSKMFFFLDPKRKGTIGISKLLSDSVFAEFCSVKEIMSDNLETKNWFSSSWFLKVYGQFMQLDMDKDGKLDRQDMYLFGKKTVTETFINRVFEEYATSSKSKLDFKNFLTFVLALTYRKSESSINYFWRILDVNKQGKLTLFNINFFFKDIIKKLQENRLDTVRVEDIADEIFDMVKPKDPTNITLKDLQNSQNGHYICGMLTDVEEFWRYDNRERFAGQDSGN